MKNFSFIKIPILFLCASYGSIVNAETTTKSSANVTMFGADTAFTSPSGDIFVGATVTDPRGGVKNSGSDGDLAFGAGLGNPFNSVGFGIGANITSLSDSFGDSGSLNLKVSRAILSEPNHVVFGSVSTANVLPWGDAKVSDQSYNIVVSGITQIDGSTLVQPLMWTVGYGSEAVLRTTGSSDTVEGLFAGLGLGITENIGASISGTENQLNAGIGFKIPNLDNISFSYGINDITNNMKRKQQTLSISYSFTDIFGV